MRVRQPQWFWNLLGVDGPWQGTVEFGGQPFAIRGGIPRSLAMRSSTQAQTEEAFGFKWKRRETFDSPQSRARARHWLFERYGDLASAPWIVAHGEQPLFLDAGCGAGLGALELIGELLPRIRYIGVDVSDAVDVAAQRFAEAGAAAAFMQADLMRLPFEPGSIDLILSEGVLHHTDSTSGALAALAALLRPGGRILFYVYRRKGPVREFTDDFIRGRLQEMSPEDAWKAIEPLTKLGIALGELEATIRLDDPIDLLGIPAGSYDLQRLFYWHVAKAFYLPEISFDEMNHINYDWYAPANAARQTPGEVRSWCAQLALEIEGEVVEEAGITIIARKAGA